MCVLVCAVFVVVQAMEAATAMAADALALQKDQPAYVQLSSSLTMDAYACNEDDCERLMVDDYILVYMLNQQFSRTMMKMTAEAISEQIDLLAKRALKMHWEAQIWCVTCVMDKLLYESGIAFPVLAKTPNIAPFFRMVTRLPKAYIDNVHQLQLVLEALHPAELIDLCTHTTARNFIINIVKNVSLDTTEMENTIFEYCHKDALLNGAYRGQTRASRSPCYGGAMDAAHPRNVSAHAVVQAGGFAHQ